MTKVITYSFAPSGLLFGSDFGYNLPGTYSESWNTVYSGTPYKAKTKAAFQKWADVSNFVAVELPDPGTTPGSSTAPEVRLYTGRIDNGSAGGLNVQAFAYYTFAGGGRASDIVFESDPLDVAFINGSMFDSLMLHELGHGIIDRPHVTEPDSVMNGISNATLGTGDIAAARFKYPGANNWSDKIGHNKPLGLVYSIYYASTLAFPDTGGLVFWTNAIAGGTQTAVNLANGLLYHTAGLNDPDWFWITFHRVLGRYPQPSDQAFYHARIASVGRGQVLAELAGSPEAATRRQAILPNQWW